MSVGDQHHLPATALQCPQEGVGVRTQADEMRNLALQFDNRQPQLTGPVVQAVPVQLALNGIHHGVQFRLGPFNRLAVMTGIAGRHVLQPEVVIKVQIEQCAVHIEQHGINCIPVEHWRLGLGLRCGYDTSGRAG